jgi:hypothetical protein
VRPAAEGEDTVGGLSLMGRGSEPPNPTASQFFFLRLNGAAVRHRSLYLTLGDREHEKPARSAAGSGVLSMTESVHPQETRSGGIERTRQVKALLKAEQNE